MKLAVLLLYEMEGNLGYHVFFVMMKWVCPYLTLYSLLGATVLKIWIQRSPPIIDFMGTKTYVQLIRSLLLEGLNMKEI